MPSQPGEPSALPDHLPVSPPFTTGTLLSALTASGAVMESQRPWGVMRGIHVPELNFTVKHLLVEEGARTSLQVHEWKDEVIIILGSHLTSTGDAGFVEAGALGGELARHTSGIIHITPGLVHRVTGPLEYLEIALCDPADADTTRLSDDYGRE